MRSAVRTASNVPATAPTRAPTRFPRSAVLSSSSRRSATAFVSSRRSSAISRRRADSLGIAQRLRSELGLLQGLLGYRAGALLQHLDADQAEDSADQDEPAAHDQEGSPDRQRGRKAGGGCRKSEAERQEAQDYCPAGEADAYADRRGLLLQLGGCELQLELDEGARVIGHALRCAGKSYSAHHRVLLTTPGAP